MQGWERCIQQTTGSCTSWPVGGQDGCTWPSQAADRGGQLISWQRTRQRPFARSYYATNVFEVKRRAWIQRDFIKQYYSHLQILFLKQNLNPPKRIVINRTGKTKPFTRKCGANWDAQPNSLILCGGECEKLKNIRQTKTPANRKARGQMHTWGSTDIGARTLAPAAASFVLEPVAGQVINGNKDGGKRVCRHFLPIQSFQGVGISMSTLVLLPKV